MDRFRSYISVVLKGVCIDKERRQELEDEILDHLEMIKLEFLGEGYSEDEAEVIAMQRFGETNDIKSKFKGTFTPYKRLRYELNKRKLLKESLQWAASIAIALIFAVSLRSYAFAGAQVKQCSMQNTLFEGQRLVENKLAYSYTNPKRRDIIIINRNVEKGVLNIFIQNSKEVIQGFYKNNDDQDNQKERLVKRIIGLPGDKIDIRNGKVYLNGALYKESYIKGSTFPNNMKFPVTVPKNHYFVMGDNREVSLDSRDLGFISSDKIEGKVVLRVWPLDKFGGI
jgi:signal peptidase I